MKVLGAILGVIAAIILIGGIIVGGYQLGWWLRANEINRGAEIRRNSFEYQETRRDEVVRQSETLSDLDTQLTNPDLTAEQRQALTAQRIAAVRQMCNIAADLDPAGYTPTVASIVSQEC